MVFLQKKNYKKKKKKKTKILFENKKSESNYGREATQRGGEEVQHKSMA